MQNIATIIVLLAVVTALAQITDLIKVPYPILLVLAGVGIGFIEWIPPVTLHPDVIFLVFLPPILYDAAWSTSWPDFKAAKRPITLLAIGCVIFTTCAVAYVAHMFIPSLGWAEAFVLGAIISPPDAVAAAASTKGLAVPKRVVTILEGESLVNDATGLIAYRYAVAAVVTGSFSLWEAGYKFVLVAAGGILLGLLLGWIFKVVFQITPNNPTTDTTFTFITPYVSYLFAEAIHVSGVLAVVTTALYLNRYSSEIFSQQTRLQASGAWKTVIFILNGIIFIMIGLQLPHIASSLRNISMGTLLTYGAIVSVTAIVGRILWVVPATYLPRILVRSIRENEPKPKKRLVALVAWSGMRGVVSLAAALALPLVIEGSKPFPNRNLIIFLTFCVIFATLVVQGLSLRPLIKLFGIKADGSEHEAEATARLQIATSIIEYIEETYSLAVTEDVLNQIKTKYEIRIQRLRKDAVQKLNEQQLDQFHSIQQQLLQFERKLVIELRKEGKISDEALRKIEYELDLEETRLILEKIG
jgi:monovalent cation/hydrogen antiporter